MRLPWDLDAISGGIRANSTSSQGSGNSWLIGRITSAAVVLGVRFLAFSTAILGAVLYFIEISIFARLGIS